MKDLKQTKSDLRKVLIDNIPTFFKLIKELLPEGSEKSGEVLLIEGRFNDENKKLLRGTVTNVQLQLAYNQIRSDLMDFIDALTEDDFSAEEGAPKDPKGGKRGELLYRIPDEMKLEEETKCIVRIALSDEEIIKNLELDEHVELRSLSRVSNLMQVTLIDPSDDAPFAIRTINEPEQLIYEDSYTEWTFYVKPLREGTFPLIIKVAVIELIYNKERKREIVFEEEINVSTQAVPDEKLRAPFKKSEKAFLIGGTSSEIGKASAAAVKTGSEPVNKGKTSHRTGSEPVKKGKTSQLPKLLGLLILLVAAGGLFRIYVNTNPKDGDPFDQTFAMTEAYSSPRYEYEEVNVTTAMAVFEVIEQPAEYETVSEQIEVSPASTKFITVPAEYATVTKRILVAPQGEKFICIPPEFSTKNEKIVVVEKLKTAFKVQPKYKTVRTKIEIKPKVIIYECKEPQVSFVDETYEITPERTEFKEIPPVYETVTDTIEKGYTEKKVAKPEFEFIEEEITVEPKSTRWILEKKENCISSNPKECLIMVEQTIPAKTKKVSGWQFSGCPEGYDYNGEICEQLIVVPPQTKMRRVMVKEASKEEVVVPPQIGTRKVKKYTSEASFTKKVIPAEYKMFDARLIQNRKVIGENNIEKIYETIKVQILTKPASYKKEAVPAKFETVTIQAQSTAEQVIAESTQATYRTVTKRKLVKPEEVKIIKRQPAKTETIRKKKMIDSGGKPIQVEALQNPSKETIVKIQTVLQNEGFYKGAITGEVNVESLTALSQYQNENALPIGVLDRQTLEKMQIKL